jgi:hypothetical protein
MTAGLLLAAASPALGEDLKAGETVSLRGWAAACPSREAFSDFWAGKPVPVHGCRQIPDTSRVTVTVLEVKGAYLRARIRYSLGGLEVENWISASDVVKRT